MAEKINVEITRREAIKPSSQTPKHLRIFRLSFLFQFNPDSYVPLILFYPSKGFYTLQNPIETASERWQRLRETLSKALALYYPFAGRLRKNFVVECNDEGAEFIEAKAAFPMSVVFEKPRPHCTRFLGAGSESKTHAAALFSLSRPRASSAAESRSASASLTSSPTRGRLADS